MKARDRVDEGGLPKEWRFPTADARRLLDRVLQPRLAAAVANRRSLVGARPWRILRRAASGVLAVAPAIVIMAGIPSGLGAEAGGRCERFITRKGDRLYDGE